MAAVQNVQRRKKELAGAADSVQSMRQTMTERSHES